MNEMIPDKHTYQKNKRRMAWTALGMMIVSTVAVLIDPARMAEADAVLMMMYGSLSALVGAYFGFSSTQVTKSSAVATRKDDY
jgi:hypothetical protein